MKKEAKSSKSRAKKRKYGLGAAGFGAGGADKVKDGFGGLEEVGVGGELRVLLRLLHAPEERSAVPTLEGHPCHAYGLPITGGGGGD